MSSMPTIYHRRFLLSAFRSLNSLQINSGSTIEIDSIDHTINSRMCSQKWADAAAGAGFPFPYRALKQGNKKAGGNRCKTVCLRPMAKNMAKRSGGFSVQALNFSRALFIDLFRNQSVGHKCCALLTLFKRTIGDVPARRILQ